MKLYRRYFTTAALIWAGLLLLFLFTYILVLLPQKKTRKQLERQLAEKKQIYDSALQASREETKLKLNEQIEHLRDELKDFVIDFEDSANLTFDIGKMAGEKKVASFRIKTKKAPRGAAVPDCEHLFENHIDISFTAGFNQFATVLNALERHRPVVFVDGFKIIRSEQDDSGHKVNMNLAVFVKKAPSG